MDRVPWKAKKQASHEMIANSFKVITNNSQSQIFPKARGVHFIIPIFKTINNTETHHHIVSNTLAYKLGGYSTKMKLKLLLFMSALINFRQLINSKDLQTRFQYLFTSQQLPKKFIIF